MLHTAATAFRLPCCLVSNITSLTQTTNTPPRRAPSPLHQQDGRVFCCVCYSSQGPPSTSASSSSPATLAPSSSLRQPLASLRFGFGLGSGSGSGSSSGSGSGSGPGSGSGSVSGTVRPSPPAKQQKPEPELCSCAELCEPVAHVFRPEASIRSSYEYSGPTKPKAAVVYLRGLTEDQVEHLQEM